MSRAVKSVREFSFLGQAAKFPRLTFSAVSCIMEGKEYNPMKGAVMNKQIKGLLFAALAAVTLCGCGEIMDEVIGAAVDEALGELSTTEAQQAEPTEAVPKEENETPAEPQAESETDYNYEITYTFRNDSTLRQHFEKHGAEFSYVSEQEYVEGANSVIVSPDALHKTEAEDGDDVYYLEETNEFVVVSTDGYIRTYFKPTRGIDYFYAQ